MIIGIHRPRQPAAVRAPPIYAAGCLTRRTRLAASRPTARIHRLSQMSGLGLRQSSADFSSAVETAERRLRGLDEWRRIHDAVRLDGQRQVKVLFGHPVPKL
jgi:hypothetical protein